MARGRKLIPMAIAYDFDGTLGPGNMQEFDFVPAIGMRPARFWAESNRHAKKHQADNILAYMHQMLRMANTKEVPVRKADFQTFGKTVKLFNGVTTWFDRINAYGRKRGVKVEHFIISSGIREMIEGTPIAQHFTAIFASGFIYDQNGVAVWPALALNYTTKTQYLFRINKGSLDVYDHSRVNRFVPKRDRPVPFENMVFIGDGETDVPCMRLVKDQGGHSIAVYKPNTGGAKEKAIRLRNAEGRVNFTAPADYSNNKPVERIVFGIIDKVAADGHLRSLGKEE